MLKNKDLKTEMASLKKESDELIELSLAMQKKAEEVVLEQLKEKDKFIKAIGFLILKYKNTIPGSDLISVLKEMNRQLFVKEK